jgi:ribonuclease P protein subunit POP4
LNLPYYTLIGIRVKIIKSSQEDLIGLEGTVVDETKNLIVISSRGKEMKIPKNSSTFRFYPEEGEPVDIRGREISFRPHERPKKV